MRADRSDEELVPSEQRGVALQLIDGDDTAQLLECGLLGADLSQSVGEEHLDAF